MTSEFLQNELADQQRRALLGTLTVAVAHEYNNLMQVVIGNAQLAQYDKDPDKIQERLSRIVEYAGRAGRISRQLANLGRGNRLAVDLCPLRPLIDQAVVACARPFEKDRIELVIDVPAEIRIQANETYFVQLILNLLTNARAALGTSPRRVRVSAQMRGDAVAIEVSDTGAGLSEKQLESEVNRFFAADFSYPPSGDSIVGLGLEACKAIVQIHGARIHARANEDGPGCTFALCWPAA